MNNIEINLSVHFLVDVLLRKGDIDNRIFNKATMAEGTRIHAYYQKKAGNNYIAEYPLKISETYKGFVFNIEGRADGLIINDNEVIIDEIKSCVGDIDEFFEKNFEWHLGQAKVYAYMYMKDKNIDNIDISLTYISQIDRTTKQHNYKFSYIQIKNFFFELLDRYLDFYRIINDLHNKRNVSVVNLTFPYHKFRKGQDILVERASQYVINGEKCLIEASTGIGKTISLLYPHIKEFGDKIDKIFFATAKTSGQNIVKGTLDSLIFKGLKTKNIFITAKESLCPMKEKLCNPDKCPYARGYYNKIFNLLIKILSEEVNFYDKEYFENIAKEYEICPFETQLDVSTFCDIVVCDYNYIFDPFVYLERFVDADCSKFSLLIDEAHNLVSRGRAMYSCEISLENIKKVKKGLKKIKALKVKKALSSLEKSMEEELIIQDEDNRKVEYFNENFGKSLSRLVLACQDLMKESKIEIPTILKDFYLEAKGFCKIYEWVDDNFTLYLQKTYNDFLFKIFCVAPTKFISAIINKFHDVFCFSATLSPFPYYNQIIFNNNPDVLYETYPSPFKSKNFNLIINPFISLKYKDRTNSIDEICSCIDAFCHNHIGNYLLFVPSYEYISMLKSHLFIEDANIVFQFEKMKSEDKEKFLSSLIKNPKKTTICIAVLGGQFSESIDLKGDLLIGVIVLGVGFPKISFENDEIKKYYDEYCDAGFSYAYLYPGMNAVTQSVGRLIRAEDDIGSALLIDSRYLESRYQNLFKKEWSHYKIVSSPKDIYDNINNFYKNIK